MTTPKSTRTLLTSAGITPTKGLTSSTGKAHSLTILLERNQKMLKSPLLSSKPHEASVYRQEMKANALVFETPSSNPMRSDLKLALRVPHSADAPPPTVLDLTKEMREIQEHLGVPDKFDGSCFLREVPVTLTYRRHRSFLRKDDPGWYLAMIRVRFRVKDFDSLWEPHIKGMARRRIVRRRVPARVLDSPADPIPSFIEFTL